MFSSICVFAAILAVGSESKVHEAVLGNGMRIVTLEDRSCPIVAVQVWYHVGSKDEDPERQGFAHMFEHMMFRGTDRLGPEAHFEYIRSAGGDCNAYTSFDQTVYVQTLPKDQLPMVLWLEAERMASLAVDRAGFETERAVVEEERRMGLNQPYGSVLEKVLAQVFSVHPYRWSTIGNIEHLRRATPEELLRFWETYYVPNNATLVVVGDVSHEAVVTEAERAFGWIPKCDAPPRVTVKEPLFEKPREITIEEERGPVPIVGVGYRTVGMGHPDALPLEMLMTILGGGESSRLYRKIVDEAEVAVIAMGGAMAFEHEGFAGAGAVLMPFADMKKPLAMIEAELASVLESGVTDGELKKAKTNFLRRLVDSSATVESMARQVGTAAVFEGGASRVEKRAAEIEAVTVEDLKRVAATYFVPERKLVLRIEPTVGGMLRSLFSKKEEAAEETEKPKIESKGEPALARLGPKADAKRPEGYPAQPPVAPPTPPKVDFTYKSKTLANGLRVVVVENHELPRVSVVLGLRNGEFTEEEDAPGSAAMAMSMLMKGTRTKSAQQIADLLENNAIELSAGADLDSCSISGSALAPQKTLLVKMLAEIVKSPTFPEKEFSKLKRQAITGKKIGEKQPASIADREFARALFGAHPYARESGGSSADLERLKLGDVVAWWNTYARPDLAVLYIAGDIVAEDAFDLAAALLEDWESAGNPPGRELPTMPEHSATRITLVDVPGAIQSQIRVGHLGFERAAKESFAGRVLTQIFGGAFNSRLNETIRVKKGLTYGARGGFSSQRFGGRFFVSTFSKTASTVEAVRAILDEIERMRAEPPTTEELSQAKSYLLGSFPGAHETPGSIVNQLWTLELDGLGVERIDEYLRGVAKTTAEDVTKLALDRIDPSSLSIVVVGDAARIAEGLKAVAPVTIVGEDGAVKSE